MGLTSRSKFSLTNSNELKSEWIAASWTSQDGSSFRAPWITAVNISFERNARVSGFCKSQLASVWQHSRVPQLTIDSQINPIAWRVAILRFVALEGLLTKPRSCPTKSGHWSRGNSTAAIAATTCAATAPALLELEPRVVRDSCLILSLTAGSVANHLFA